MRPESYSEGFSVTIDTQYASIKGKLQNRFWLKSVSRQAQQYWYRGFRKQAARIGLLPEPMAFLETAHESSFPFASHSLKHNVNFSISESPHLIFAATDPEIPP